MGKKSKMGSVLFFIVKVNYNALDNGVSLISNYNVRELIFKNM